MVDSTLISQVKKLSAADRLELIGTVWETFAPYEVPIGDSEKLLLDSRLADLDAHPDDQSPWLEVRERLRRQIP